MSRVTEFFFNLFSRQNGFVWCTDSKWLKHISKVIFLWSLFLLSVARLFCSIPQTQTYRTRLDSLSTLLYPNSPRCVQCVGWFAASPILGAYTNAATASMGDMGKLLLPAWAVSIPLGIGIRALSKGGEMPPVPFAVTSMIFTLVALAAWRGLYTSFNPTSTDEYKRGGILDGFRMITTLLQRW